MSRVGLSAGRVASDEGVPSSTAATSLRDAPEPAAVGPRVSRPDHAPAVGIQALSKRFASSGPLVLDDVTLTVERGEFVCLIGASGCGKSTLLNIIGGLDAPTAGTVSVPTGRAAVMFQEPALFPWLSAARNVELALKLARTPRAARRSRALELLDLVNLADAADKRPHELSGGMRQRVALARALAQDRAVLLMDEPFAALDAITRDLLHEELERVWRQTGRTIVFVTHNVREAVRLGQRVVLLSSRPGRVAAEWQVEVVGERRIEAPDVSRLAIEITDQLRREIRRAA